MCHVHVCFSNTFTEKLPYVSFSFSVNYHYTFVTCCLSSIITSNNFMMAEIIIYDQVSVCIIACEKADVSNRFIHYPFHMPKITNYLSIFVILCRARPLINSQSFSSSSSHQEICLPIHENKSNFSQRSSTTPNLLNWQ